MLKSIQTNNAPAPIGPYSQAIKAGNMLFISGQIALNPTSGELEITDRVAETNRVMLNLQAILKEAGFTFENVVKSSIFLSDMNDFGTVNEVYAKYVSKLNPPARETVQVSVLPKNVNVEISMIAFIES
jgi:2-iminobutanoate/2-iminopropanoate deaminase